MRINFNTLLLLWLLLIGFTTNGESQKKNKLKNKAVKDLGLMTENQEVIVAGSVLKIGFQIVLETGAVMYTTGMANGKIGWNSFIVEVRGGVFRDGILTISNDPAQLAAHKVTLSVQSLSKNGYQEDFEIEINYVKNIELSHTPGAGLSPGRPVPLTVTAYLNTGKKMSTALASDDAGYLSWNSIILTLNGNQISGECYVPADPRVFLENRNIVLKVVHVTNLEVSSELVIPLDFKGPHNYSGKGLKGVDGAAGSTGSEGRSGANGYSTSSSRVSHGGSGDSGGRGNDGMRGGYGNTGAQVEVYVTTYEHRELGTLLKAEVIDRSTQQVTRFLINTSDGNLMLDLRGGTGGAGGAGGKGGRGGSGGRGASTTTSNGSTIGGGSGGNGGNGGSGGNGGMGGDGGDGGTAVIYLDPSVGPYRQLLLLRNEGGNPGPGGRAGEGGVGGIGGDGRGGYSDGVRGQQGYNGQYGGSGRQGRVGLAPQYVNQNVSLSW